jgi:predicted transposase/invertase (TIGR01784 family)
MADKRVASQFLKAHLPKDLSERIDFECLTMEPRSFINDLRKETTVDILFKTRIDLEEAYIYLLLEHQSTPDELMPFRIVKYSCNAIDYCLKINKTKKIPLIYPLVIYHGKQPYPFSTDINDLVDAPKQLVEKYFLKPFQLLDLGRIDDESIRQNAWSGIMEFALKHIFARDILPHLRNIADLMQQVAKQGGSDYLAIVLQYLLERGELSDKDAFFNLIDQQISHQVGEKIMSLAQQLRQEGKIAGELALIKRMLANGVDPVFIAKNTGFSISKIKELQSRKDDTEH